MSKKRRPNRVIDMGREFQTFYQEAYYFATQEYGPYPGWSGLCLVPETRSGKIQCGYCGVSNDESRSKCEHCGAPLPSE